VNKKQLITRVQRYMGPGATLATASAAVEAVLSCIITGATDSKGVCITRFGVFRKKEKEGKPPGLHFQASRQFNH